MPGRNGAVERQGVAGEQALQHAAGYEGCQEQSGWGYVSRERCKGQVRTPRRASTNNRLSVHYENKIAKLWAVTVPAVSIDLRCRERVARVLGSG